ncbi:uncharacterized protein HKW66_Vig0113090 [Vigna angularis]|uniref:Uncharacterized protein n=1 Tax=Phaseolus angularis TaxID=3914 RepID=A0A8T0KWP3_PHAAN|nr:uncharacterized protein HKW66_Vig0113090 [Vigna angularis]
MIVAWHGRNISRNFFNASSTIVATYGVNLDFIARFHHIIRFRVKIGNDDHYFVCITIVVVSKLK